MTRELPAFVEEQDVFFVGGGNTANLLAEWRAHGLDKLLRAWRAGAVLSGISAGMLCWFQGGIIDSFGGYRPIHDGLGLLRGTACPHYDGEPSAKRLFEGLSRKCAGGLSGRRPLKVRLLGSKAGVRSV